MEGGGCERPLDLEDLTFQEAASFLEGRAQGLKQGCPADFGPPEAKWGVRRTVVRQKQSGGFGGL